MPCVCMGEAGQAASAPAPALRKRAAGSKAGGSHRGSKRSHGGLLKAQVPPSSPTQLPMNFTLQCTLQTHPQKTENM